MKRSVVFLAGFAAGWLTRSTVDASRSAAVQVVAFGLDAVTRLRRVVAIELERLDDVVAEAEGVSARRRAGRGATPRVVEHHA